MKKYSKFLAIMLVFAMILPGIAQAAPVAAAETQVVRVEGAGREETAIAASKVAYPTGAENVVLAGYAGDVDALTGTLLANAMEAPLLLTRAYKLTEKTKEEIVRLGAKTVYVLGGEAAVQEKVLTELKDMGLTVERVSGDNRYETAVAAGKKSGVQTKHVFLAKGQGILADALAVGPASAKEKMPVLLTTGNMVPEATMKALKDWGVTHVTIVGGEKAITPAVVTQLKDYTVDRVEGLDREKTAVAIADKYFAGSTKAIVANGYVYADALVGGYLGALQNAPIVLVDTDVLKAASTGAHLAKVNKAWILGGTNAVNAATEAKVVAAVVGTELEILSVNAINAKTLEVKFNKAVSVADQAKAVIEVKRGSIKPSVKETKFAEDMMSATIEFNAAMIAGDYTVTVSGLTDEALTGMVKVEAEKLTKIEFLSDVAVISGNNITMNVQAENQYKEVINNKLVVPTNSNISVTASKGTTGHTIDKDGLLTVKGNALDFKADDKVVVTIVDSSTGVTATKTVTVAKAAQVQTIELGELKTDDVELAKKPINVTNMNTDYAKYYVPVVVKDQYGNTLKAAELVGVDILSSNDKIVKIDSPKFVDVAKIGTVIKFAQPTATATHGTAVLTVVSAGTGKTASVSVKVLEDAKTDVLIVTAPETALKVTTKTELPFSAADQYGNALVSNTELVKDGASTPTVLKFTDGSSITATGANIDYSVDYGNKNKVKLHITPTAKNVVLTAVSATGKAQTLNLIAEEAPKASSLGGLSKDIYKAIQKDETQTIKFTDVIVKDQYGEDIALPTDYTLTFAAVDTILDTVTFDKTVLKNVTDTEAIVTAAAKGTEAIEITLKDDSSVVLDTVVINLETVELKDISTFGLKEIGKFYSGATYRTGNGTADYDKTLEIYGKKGSTEVLVDQDLLVSSTSTAPIVVANNIIVQDHNKIVTNGVDKTATVTGVIAGADSPITVTQELTYNDAKSVISKVIVRNTAGAKSEITDGAVVVPSAQVASNKKIGPVGATSTFQFYAKDQYGVDAKGLSYTVTNKQAAATDISIASDGTITVTGTALSAGESFTITAIADGVIKTVKVIVGL